MKAQLIVPQCQCDSPIIINQLMVSQSRELLIRGFCPMCDAQVHTKLSLVEMSRMASKLADGKPEPVRPPIATGKPEALSQDDLDWLKWLHINGVQ